MLTRTIVNRPTTFFIVFALITGFGLYTALDLPLDLFPEIEPSVLVVQTDYEGASPEEVERTITRPLEGALSNVSNLNQVSSTSSRGNSQIELEFTWGTNMDAATNEVRDRLDPVRNALPDDSGSPSIFRFDPSLIPILDLRMAGERTPEELRELAQDIVEPEIEKLDGIALTSISGGRERVIRTDIDRERLDAYGLTLTRVRQALQSQNVQFSGGTIQEGETEYTVETAGRFTSVDELRRAVVTLVSVERQDGPPIQVPVRLGDLGTVEEGFRPQQSAVYINGEPGVSISVQKQSDANSVDAADSVINGLDRINDQLPGDVRLEVISDTTEIIRNSLRTVSNQAISGGILAVIVLFFFLRSSKATAVVAVSIPTSIIFTITLMYFFGLTLNIMTLAGLALGVGLLVDNSIVILENIYRYREKGTKLRPAAVLGTQEMTNAIVASTLTTITVFLPVAFFRDQLDFIGELFAGLSFTVVISLSASLLVAIFLVPVLSSHYFPLVSRTQRPKRGVFDALDLRMERMFTALDTAYKQSLAAVLRHKAITVIVIVALFLGSLALLPGTGFELLPDQEQDNVTVDVELPVGTRLEVTEQVLEDFEAIVQREIEGYEDIVLNVGGGGFFGGSNSNSGSIQITLPPFEERVETATEVQEILRGYLGRFPGAEITFGGGGGPGGGGNIGGGAPIDIRIRSENLERSRDIAEQIRSLIASEVPDAVDPELNISEGLPQVNVNVDRERAYSLGLDMASIGEEVRANIDGVTASQLELDGTETDIFLILEEQDRLAVPDLNRIYVDNQAGTRIPLSNFASLERTTGPVSIRRTNQAREIQLTAGLADGATAAQVEPQIRELVDERIPPEDGVTIDFSGELEDIIDYGTTFIGIIIVALLLVYGVMAAQFESFRDPFIIFLSIPLTLIGVIGIHDWAGVNLSIFTAVGLVMLVGIVVNNGIVLVDYINLLRARGEPLVRACVDAGGNRLRPILMTTLTTVLGLVPIAFLSGEGSELIQPIALTVIGGLSVSTLLTLFFVPTLYAAFNAGDDKRKRRREQKLERQFESHEFDASIVDNSEDQS
ncbi:MAG: efflux RND transporter permease subunit [Spirochaetales bacterium]